MTTKVLIVDDEKLERVLIRNGYQWEQYGFEVIGEADSGAEALEFVKFRQPDIILTDINMPEMDGLELTRQIIKIYPDCRIVIITGYREFEYARQAVKLGVEDFLLKPINVSDIAASMERLKKEIDKENREKLEIRELRTNSLVDRDVVKESFFQRLVEGRIPEDEALRRLMMYDCFALPEQSICINIKILRKPENVHSDKILNLVYRQNWQNVLCFVHYMNNILLFFMGGIIDDIEVKGRFLHKEIYQLFSLETTVGMSDVNYGYDGISASFYQSEDACGASVLLGQNQFISYQTYQKLMSHNEQIGEFDWERLLFAVNNGVHDQVDALISDFSEILRKSGNVNVEYLRLCAMDLLSKASVTLNKYGMDINQLMAGKELYQCIQNLATLDGIIIFVRDTVNTITDYHCKLKIKKENKAVKEALQYIRTHLYEPGLSLKTIAAHIYANESYLSRVFKKERGISIIAYIMKLRIDESIRLLSTTDMLVYEIAEKIGFREAHYFSICFKKQTGLTIKEFKAGRTERQ